MQQFSQCPRCGTQNHPQQTFCAACGNQLFQYQQQPPSQSSGYQNYQQQQPINQQLYSCPNCHNQVRYGDVSCASCGMPFNWQPQQQATPQYQQQQQRFDSHSEEKPKKKMSPWLIGCLGLIGAVILIGVGIFVVDLLSQGRATTTPAQTPSSSSTPTPTPIPTVTVYSIGQDVTVSNQVKWRVLTAKNRGSVLRDSESRLPGFYKDKTTTGKFIEVTFVVENLSGSTQNFVSTPKIVDSQSREFDKAEEYWGYVPKDMDFVGATLQPNIPKQAVVIYELPQDATGLKLKVSDFGIIYKKSALINLGL